MSISHSYSERFVFFWQSFIRSVKKPLIHKFLNKNSLETISIVEISVFPFDNSVFFFSLNVDEIVSMKFRINLCRKALNGHTSLLSMYVINVVYCRQTNKALELVSINFATIFWTYAKCHWKYFAVKKNTRTIEKRGKWF